MGLSEQDVANKRKSIRRLLIRFPYGTKRRDGSEVDNYIRRQVKIRKAWVGRQYIEKAFFYKSPSSERRAELVRAMPSRERDS